MTRTPMSPQIFAILSGLVEEKLGLHYALSDKDVFEDKLTVRALDAGYDSLLDYYYFLRYDPGGEAELEALGEALVVGETYLFRELDQLEIAVDRIIAPIVASGRRARMWSAACATGEEPLTLAMLLDARGLLASTEIVATDLSARSLARAKTGTFGPRALRGHAATPRWAEPRMGEVDGRVSVRRDLVAAVSFRRLNLLDAAAVGALGRFDVIVCRNVLIYFRDEVIRRVVDTLAASLSPGGALIVGTSESLLRVGTALACEELGGVFVYRKDPGR